MKKTLLFLSVVTITLYLNACAVAGGPVFISGFAYTDAKVPFAATPETDGHKIGKATCTSVLGLVAMGDCSIEAAKKAGGITTVSHVDNETFNVLGVYAKFTTVVKGK